MCGSPKFATTRWSLVLQVDSTDGGDAALEELCRAYWRPLHAFVLQRGFDHATAEDITQSFFAHLLNRNALQRADADRGRFRTFLLGALKNFMADHQRHQGAVKRGGRIEFINFDDLELAEISSSDEFSAEKHYDRLWAAGIVRRSLLTLEDEFNRAGKHRRFILLKDYLLTDPPEGLYARLAAESEVTESTLRSSMQRMRLRFRIVFRQEVADTVGSEAEVDQEIRHLLTVL
ncbi:MAG: sigma factor [Synoicihabitans sp.]